MQLPPPLHALAPVIDPDRLARGPPAPTRRSSVSAGLDGRNRRRVDVQRPIHGRHCSTRGLHARNWPSSPLARLVSTRGGCSALPVCARSGLAHAINPPALFFSGVHSSYTTRARRPFALAAPVPIRPPRTFICVDAASHGRDTGWERESSTSSHCPSRGPSHAGTCPHAPARIRSVQHSSFLPPRPLTWKAPRWQYAHGAGSSARTPSTPSQRAAYGPRPREREAAVGTALVGQAAKLSFKGGAPLSARRELVAAPLCLRYRVGGASARPAAQHVDPCVRYRGTTAAPASVLAQCPLPRRVLLLSAPPSAAICACPTPLSSPLQRGQLTLHERVTPWDPHGSLIEVAYGRARCVEKTGGPRRVEGHGACATASLRLQLVFSLANEMFSYKFWRRGLPCTFVVYISARSTRDEGLSRPHLSGTTLAAVTIGRFASQGLPARLTRTATSTDASVVRVPHPSLACGVLPHEYPRCSTPVCYVDALTPPPCRCACVLHLGCHFARPGPRFCGPRPRRPVSGLAGSMRVLPPSTHDLLPASRMAARLTSSGFERIRPRRVQRRAGRLTRPCPPRSAIWLGEGSRVLYATRKHSGTRVCEHPGEYIKAEWGTSHWRALSDQPVADGWSHALLHLAYALTCAPAPPDTPRCRRARGAVCLRPGPIDLTPTPSIRACGVGSPPTSPRRAPRCQRLSLTRAFTPFPRLLCTTSRDESLSHPCLLHTTLVAAIPVAAVSTFASEGAEETLPSVQRAASQRTMLVHHAIAVLTAAELHATTSSA
ncbi:hypothetical protein DFH08DRAFT_1039272 [Mycena albidolilacea]|uniref:Uncharacterized protein n=1 Tax=Mycena albidolilacea TaxID=1033008 RepID=A0AAD7F0M5_9AGAR|nr:hypothetical protein DFH08DRAFT_1039272 [Mycena albidolilacea]